MAPLPGRADPFQYLNGDEKQITNINFEGTPLRIGITTLKNDADVDAFVNLGYQNIWVVDLYVEHNGYDALDIRDQAKTFVNDEGNESSDAYCSSDDEDLGFVDFHTEGDENVSIKTLTTNEPFLNKLCSNNGHFRGFIDEHVNANVERVVKDTKSKTNNGEGTSKSPQTTTKSPQTIGKSGEGCSQSPKWTKSMVASDRVMREVKEVVGEAMQEDEILKQSFEADFRRRGNLYEREDEERLREQRRKKNETGGMTTSSLQTGQRKNHMIKNHSAKILGNIEAEDNYMSMGVGIAEPSVEANTEPKATKK
ncbi:hypothetical protein Tco_0493538 [Tanacetum coccineum]